MNLQKIWKIISKMNDWKFQMRIAQSFSACSMRGKDYTSLTKIIQKIKHEDFTFYLWFRLIRHKSYEFSTNSLMIFVIKTNLKTLYRIFLTLLLSLRRDKFLTLTKPFLSSSFVIAFPLFISHWDIAILRIPRVFCMTFSVRKLLSSLCKFLKDVSCWFSICFWLIIAT